MSVPEMLLVQVELGRGKKGLINVQQIASMEEFTKAPPSDFEEWTMVSLKNGRVINVCEGISSLLGRVEVAVKATVTV